MPKYEAFPTMITPYRADGTVDLETVKKYVHWYHDTGCHGIFAVCQSSEIFYLDEEELVAINRAVWETVQEIAASGGRRMTVVSSGHVACDIAAQARTLCRIAESGTDALILITNRLDLHNEGDDVWIANAEKLLALLPPHVKLGLYECPHPYKRLLTPRILQWCLQTGRFAFIKDTCCDPATIRERCQLLKGSELRLFNANCQTLLQSMKDGAAGYCGIMCNFHPWLYVWLCEHFQKEPEKAERLQRFLTLSGFTESGLPYPLTAKYHMSLVGNPTENYARNTDPKRLTAYVKFCVEQMKAASDEWEAYLKGHKK
ncbi:MAG: dihydrodipicolinate synthase family protein [Ruminococcaceae bacterium]|nr:dihydrodipicolinate synthase family protein [Oscillospiraceae bacterium]